MAALTAEPFLEARGSVHPGLAARHHDLVGVGFGTGEERRRVTGQEVELFSSLLSVHPQGRTLTSAPPHTRRPLTFNVRLY